ncbi:MAG: tetraacyldisaccharide 4'-kinase [Candidatus Kapabacteria bacterium]|nr:tetraacyldisaccharide 4'-kinase [Candidatus Kapabacteria bacterium]
MRLNDTIAGGIAGVYGWAVRRRNCRFDNGIGVKRVDVPVLSVGNISTGGTGKTPFTAMLALGIQERGKRVAIVSRGYRRKSKGVVTVRDTEQILSSVDQSGDELQLLARAIPGSIIIAAEQRYDGAVRAVEEYGADCIILDDGFQHRQLHRDADIVLVDDATMSSEYCIPKGILREPHSALKRATVVVHTGGFAHDDTLHSIAPDALHIRTESTPLAPCLLRHVTERDYTTVEAPYMTLCAIARPERFLVMAAHEFGTPASSITLRDHASYTVPLINTIIADATRTGIRTILTTEKDAVKLLQHSALFDSAGITVAVLPIATRIIAGEERFWNYVDGVINP